ncbi:multicilin [Hoplias malabaricus]|uniref:multicilin n=1 Tax=Hoplias malabaricus TaxID=27720 RepID=UPI00346343E2
MQTFQQLEDSGLWSGDDSVSDVIFDFPSEETLCNNSPQTPEIPSLSTPRDPLNNALQLNRQLHASLQRKQEEISGLKEKNAQLKALVEQAEHFASLLGVLRPQRVKGCVSDPASERRSSAETPHRHFTASEEHGPANTQRQVGSNTQRVKRHLWAAGCDSGINSNPHRHSRSRRPSRGAHSDVSEPYISSTGSDPEPYATSSEHDPYSWRSDSGTYSRNSEHDHNAPSKTRGHEAARSSDLDVYVKTSKHNTVFEPSDQEFHCPSLDSYSESSVHELASWSRRAEHPFSKPCAHDSYSKGSDLHSFTSAEYDPSGTCWRGSGTEVSSSSAKGSTGENQGPKRLRLDQDRLQPDTDSNPETSLGLNPDPEHVSLPSAENSSPNPSGTTEVQVYGSFHGLKVVMTSEPSDCREEEAVCFRTSIREHSTVRTNVFPHGKTFTSHTPDGSCRFLWVPHQS